MLSKPAQLLAGLESLVIIACFMVLSWRRLQYNLHYFRFNPVVFISYFIVFIGILFIHYPFGFLNPGSAIRYRSNFYPLFFLLFLHLYVQPNWQKDTPLLVD